MLNIFEPEMIAQYAINANLETGEFISEPVYVGEVNPKIWEEKINTADKYYGTYLHLCIDAKQQKTGKIEIRAIEVDWIQRT